MKTLLTCKQARFQLTTTYITHFIQSIRFQSSLTGEKTMKKKGLKLPNNGQYMFFWPLWSFSAAAPVRRRKSGLWVSTDPAECTNPQHDVMSNTSCSQLVNKNSACREGKRETGSRIRPNCYLYLRQHRSRPRADAIHGASKRGYKHNNSAKYPSRTFTSNRLLDFHFELGLTYRLGCQDQLLQDLLNPPDGPDQAAFQHLGHLLLRDLTALTIPCAKRQRPEKPWVKNYSQHEWN